MYRSVLVDLTAAVPLVGAGRFAEATKLDQRNEVRAVRGGCALNGLLEAARTVPMSGGDAVQAVPGRAGPEAECTASKRRNQLMADQRWVTVETVPA